MKFRFLILAAFATVIVEAAPIRVGIFKGTNTGNYFHTSIHTAGETLAAILANPSSAGLGDSLMIPAEGFTFSQYGALTGSQNPTAAQVKDFINALDSLDVVFVPNFVHIGGTISDTGQRSRFASFIRTKGLISAHWSIDSYGAWSAWDSAQGARFQNHPSSDRLGTLRRDSVAAADPGWRFLNRGLPDTVRFLEDWIAFTTTASVIRAKPGLKVTLRLDESSLVGGLGGMTKMDDHPYSWYREFPEGGRLFYTGLGHRSQLYTGIETGANPSTNFFRRHLYNAILWAAGFNEDGSRSVGIRTTMKGASFARVAQLSVSRSTLTVSVLKDGPHAVEVRSLDGRFVQARRGEGRVVHVIEGLRSGEVYAVSVMSDGQRLARLVTTP